MEIGDKDNSGTLSKFELRGILLRYRPYIIKKGDIVISPVPALEPAPVFVCVSVSIAVSLDDVHLCDLGLMLCLGFHHRKV